ncbi:MAG: nuclear transport factor 2 family protein [Steroidobacteraceae bacterium]
MQPQQPIMMERLLAREQIREVLARYARGVDRADGELLKSCYHPDAIEEHGGNFAGNAHAYVDGAVPRIERMGPMQHLLGSSHIDLDGDTAWVETYVWTFARFVVDGVPTDTLTGGRLHDRFEYRDGGWRIAHRRTIFDWNRDTPTREGWCNGLFKPGSPGMLLGAKGRGDPSYQRF